MMTSMRLCGGLLLALALTGCGGKGRNPSTPKPARAQPSVQVTITSPTINADLGQGDLYKATLAGHWSGARLGGAQVYLELSDSANSFVLPASSQAPGDGNFNYALRLAPDAVGNRAGTLTVRACRDARCAQPYANALATLAYRLRVAAVGDWVTPGGNAGRNRYVPVTLDPSRFVKAWETDRGGQLVTRNGSLYVLSAKEIIDSSYTFDTVLSRFDEATGAVRWEQTLGRYSHATEPAQGTYATGLTLWDDRLYLFTQGEENAIRTYSPTDGALLERVANPADWSAGGIIGQGDLLLVSGHPRLRAFDATGGLRWELETPYSRTPAIDDAHVYYTSLEGLQIVDRNSGSATSVPFPTEASPWGHTVIGDRGNVLVALHNRRDIQGVASFDLASRKWTWLSQRSEVAVMALANGVVYTMPTTADWYWGKVPAPIVVSAQDETTGAQLWHWYSGEFSLYRGGTDLVVTRNLLFVEGEKNTYALDLTTHQVVWQIPVTGALAISASRVLYISGNDKLTAVRLQ